MPDLLRVNQRLVAWPSWKLHIAGLLYTGLNEITMGEKLETAQGYGMGRSHAPIGRTPGKYVPDVLKMKFFAHSIRNLWIDIASLSSTGTNVSEPIFPISLQYQEVDLSTHQILFVDCSLVTANMSLAEGPDPSQKEIEFTVQRIYTDGISLFRDEEF